MEIVEKDIEKFLSQSWMTILWKLFHDFHIPKGAFTGIFLLGESHFSIHTFPEHKRITVDIYVCNLTKDVSNEARWIIQEIISYFQVQYPVIHTINR